MSFDTIPEGSRLMLTHKVEIVEIKYTTPGKQGGARKGAGRPPGKQTERVRLAHEAKNRMMQRIHQNADRLVNAQLQLAIGCTYLFKRMKLSNGVWTRYNLVKDLGEITQYMDGDFEDDSSVVYVMLTADKPDAKAIDSMLDRGFGRAPVTIELPDKRDPVEMLLTKFGLLEEGTEDAGETEGS
ncbi:hypothetical protein UFOVP585_30 [uncultured Caudovirales phage]|uniref:Uncharacterized protein n=1 Tax=uncultured Caudovirales phage TaxID=2100421 RepID=A0A6J5N2Y1_9CAUD|nr:hypothetical protein UFOVP585_30 [uncultured Caudovirales phage]